MNLYGKVFGDGRLIVISQPMRFNYFDYYTVMCYCGRKLYSIRRDCLTTGNTTSCGCYKVQKMKLTMKDNIHRETHGMCYSREYGAWHAMKQRCYNYNNSNYNYYGGRGIIVCDRWRYSFENFIEDMERKPSLDHSLDRINNDGNYEPENCRWATLSEQNSNRRRLV